VVKLLDKYVIQVIIMCAVVMAVLIAVLGPAKGISAGGKATDIGGTSGQPAEGQRRSGEGWFLTWPGW
jgi:hypothetical protein